MSYFKEPIIIEISSGDESSGTVNEHLEEPISDLRNREEEAESKRFTDSEADVQDDGPPTYVFKMEKSRRLRINKHLAKPVGEVHLKVSSIRESRSDDSRFSIFTGTKRLHLRADTREDRIAWMEALQAVKGMFPRMSNSELMAHIGGITVSTEKLRQRLMEEGVSEAAIQDSENITTSEFSAMQDQLVLLKQKHLLLMDTLRMLESGPSKFWNQLTKDQTN